jgi:hypothetical protein
MSIGLYILDAAGNPVPAPDVYTWSEWFETAWPERQLADDEPVPGVHVSTVFLGVDHSFGCGQAPVLWETMVWGGFLDGEIDRYSSREEALAGHQATLERVVTAELNAKPAP